MLVLSSCAAQSRDAAGEPAPTVTAIVTVTASANAQASADAPEIATQDQSPPPAAATVAPTPAQVLSAVQASGVPLVVVDGWDSEWDLPSRQADWQPVGVMLHHTANGNPGNAPSLQYLTDYQSTMVLTDHDGLAGGGRGCHVLIGRDGTAYLLRATRGPHAGIGGPMTLGVDSIPSDNANGYTFGIEIESAGYSGDIHTDQSLTDGFSEAQLDSTARVSAALLGLVGRGPESLTDHKAWAGVKQGKPDLVGDSLETFRERMLLYVS